MKSANSKYTHTHSHTHRMSTVTLLRMRRALTSSGWMDQELFDDWLCSNFLRYAPPIRPLLLLMDGHSSHYSPDTIRYAAEQEVILFTLPPNTTHKTQPLDRACFGPLKTSWRTLCQEYIKKNPGKVVTRLSFSALSSEAWKSAMTMHNITSAFRVTGIFPLDRSKLTPAASSVPSAPASPRLPYIPMLTPAPKQKREPITPSFSEAEMQSFLDDQHTDLRESIVIR